MKPIPAFRGWLLPALALVAAALPLTSPAQSTASTAAVDPDAVALLRRVTDYLGGTRQFSLEAETTIEFVMPTGQKLQAEHHVAIDVRRPDRLRMERTGDIVNQTLYYDGKSLAMNLPDYNYYATMATPETVDGMLDYARDTLEVIAPGADLLYANAFARLTDGLTSAFIVGPSVIDGVLCDHIAFQNAEVDWQIWVQQGDKPLPRKMVVNSKRMPQSPEFVMRLTRWNPAPTFSGSAFSFVPPKGAQRIDFIPAASSGTAK